MPSTATRMQRSQAAEERVPKSFSPAENKAIACLLLVVATLAFYNPIAHCGFVYSDDVAYITRNAAVRAGLTWSTVQFAFTELHTGFWHPLTWLSHALDCQLFGLNPAGHHYVSLLFHTASAVLLFLLLLEATQAGWLSLITAALFALHPENVESVAWAAERKNVLSMFFFMLALWAYGRYVHKGGTRRYVAVVSCFALALMAKTQIVTLPCVLLLWDYWPLRRMFAAPSDQPGACAPRSFSYLLKEKVPLFALAATASVITVVAQQKASAIRTLAEDSISARLGNVIVCYARYILHTVWPVRLSPIYPRAEGALSIVQIAAAAAVLLLITALVILRRDLRYLAVGWFWFLGTLFPMIGIVQVGEQAMADRYAYLSMIGLFLALVWGVAELAKTRPLARTWAAVPAGAVILALGLLTCHQLGYWRDGETLWGYALTVTGPNYLAHDNLAMVMDGEGKYDEAIQQFHDAEALHTFTPDEILKIGMYEQTKGHPQGAIAQYQKAQQGTSDPTFRSNADIQMGTAYLQMASYDRAKQSYETALQLNPESPSALVGSALLQERDGNYEQAVTELTRALKLQPNDIGLLLLADAQRHAGHFQEAASTEDLARKISPDLDAARKNAVATQSFFGSGTN
ncbi:MAG TPA: tetratricopeptide repeat protein [Verrucomicrobiae bacterium]|nr:tetratricopeptide repeat protein [Verrucomicrobiae bacterium]